MTDPTHIQACVLPKDWTTDAFLRLIPIVTEPYVPRPTLSGLTPLEEEEFRTTNSIEMRRTHFTYVGDDNASRSLRLVPLPDTHPTCPTQWTEDAWNERIVYGDSKIHMFTTAAGKERFILKVSRDKNHEEKWVYEDFDPYSLWPQGLLLEIHANRLLLNLLAQVDAIEGKTSL